MARNNLRVLYNNIVDLSTTEISASTTSGTHATTNLKSDIKSKVWRATATTATLTVTCAAVVPQAIVMAFTNLSSTATATVSFNGGASDPLLTDVLIAPYTAFGYWTETAIGTNAYSYGAGSLARIYIPESLQVSCTSISIAITNTANVEISRLIIGPTWSPRFNTSYGLSAGVQDMSSHQRTEAGDLWTTRGPRYDKLAFDLKYMDMADRTQFMRILKGNGLPRPMFISLFPEDADADKEQQHQIYGKLSQLNDISHPILDMYSTQIQLESI